MARCCMQVDGVARVTHTVVMFLGPEGCVLFVKSYVVVQVIRGHVSKFWGCWAEL